MNFFQQEYSFPFMIEHQSNKIEIEEHSLWTEDYRILEKSISPIN